MNLDLDDPLGDLLSDGSNDSFFGIEPAKKIVPKLEKKDEKPAGSKMEQLFGIAEEKAETNKPKTSELKLFSSELTSSPINTLPKRPATTSRQLVEQLETKSNNDSLSSDLGFDPKKPRKKGNILDELLGINEGNSSAAKNQLQAKPFARENPQPSSRATISRQTTSETVSENINVENPSSTAAAGIQPPRKSGRRQSAVVFSDPLGLFGPNEREKEQIKKAQTKNARKSIAGSEWLFNDTEKMTTAPLTKLKSSPAIQITSNSDERFDIEPASNVTSLESKNTLTTTLPSTAIAQKNPPQLMESLVSETTNSLHNLKQQEFQLMVATQMKTQENVLIEMKNKQQELLKQQEHQFNDLLKKQIGRQSELEEIIKHQQERINNHIQALMASHAQTPFMENLMPSKIGTIDEIGNTNPLEKITLEADVKRLEMEKLRLEDVLSNINDNHEKEVIMIETSYKKRLQMMEENLKSMEHRYRNEIASMETFFTDKIKSISEERENVISNFEVKIKRMEESHQNFIDKLKASYESDLEMLKRHYEEMMQNIRSSKFIEFAIKEETSSYSDMLKRASSNLETASGDIQSLHEMMQEKLILLERDKEIQLSAREKRIEEQQKLLERTRETSEMERQKLLDLVQTLEMKLNSIEQKSDEEQWCLKQKLISFEVERKSFEKEKEFLRNQIAVEQQKLQELKQSQLNEHTKLLNEIEGERLKLQEDRARIEMAKTLQSKNSDDSGLLNRAEIDAAVKYAEDAAMESEKQRERLIEMQRQCDVKRQEMMERENSLRTKQSELENSIIRTKQKEQAAENFLKQTKKTELMLMAKYQSLQKYTMEQSEREAKIARERLDVNQEKLKLQAERKKLYETRCSLCKVGEKAAELKGIIQKDSTDFDDINSANNEQVNFENFNETPNGFGTFYNQDLDFMPSSRFNVDLEHVPNLSDMNDDLLDSDLLMLKFDVLNSARNNFNFNYKDF